MVGDSDENDLPEEHGDEDIFPGEDEDEEDDPLQVTSQELRRLRTAERQRQLARQLEEQFPQAEESQQEAKPPLGFPPPPVPPWLSRLPSPPPAEPARFAPPPLADPASARRRPAPFTAPPRQPLAPDGVRRTTAIPAPLSGWRSVRLHSHWLFPVLLVAIFFVLVLLTRPQVAGAMIFIFAAIGLIQAALLLYAPNDAFWAVAVVVGFILFVSATFFVLFLPIFALILSILLIALGGVALRERYFPVSEGTVAVMGLFGRYNRTLPPGFNLRIPGESLLGVVETHSIRKDVPMPPLTLLSGEQIMLSVAITYQVVPGEEHRAILLTKDWQKPIQQQLQLVVQDEVSRRSIDDFRPSGGARAAEEGDDTQDASPLDRINERLTNAMSMKVAERGVAVHEVKARLLGPPRAPGGAPIAPHPAPPSHLSSVPTAHPTVALPGMSANLGQVVEGSVQSPAGAPLSFNTPLGMVGQPMTSEHPYGPPVAPPPIGGAVPPAPAPPQPMTLLSAQALAETYDAVLRHRISDLATIQRIISQFEAVAADPTLSQQVPFDAAAGARLLSNHLYHLQMRSLSQLGQQQNGEMNPPPAPMAPAEQEED
jgi:hypothetical protein